MTENPSMHTFCSLISGFKIRWSRITCQDADDTASRDQTPHCYTCGAKIFHKIQPESVDQKISRLLDQQPIALLAV